MTAVVPVVDCFQIVGQSSPAGREIDKWQVLFTILYVLPRKILSEGLKIHSSNAGRRRQIEQTSFEQKFEHLCRRFKQMGGR